ncbi:hypothetical protein B296_00056166 [Ensete ventricosum]|uniref:Uncharacterized protein n=1 Tax=Ensete ventricosum TaxID=4639 RepID=A0A426XG64_ENSVE|nr:hypothetical protein B296_00056166 [Ensete ventricosum]
MFRRFYRGSHGRLRHETDGIVLPNGVKCVYILSSTSVHLLSRHLPPLPTEPTRSTPISQRALILLPQPWHPFFHRNRSPAKSRPPPQSPTSPTLRHIGTSDLRPCKRNTRECSRVPLLPADTHQRRASAAHLSAAAAPLPAAPFRRSYSASSCNTSTRLTARRAHLRLFHLNTSTRLPLFLCFLSQLLPATSVSLSLATSHTYSQPASLFIAGCFLFFSSPNNRISVLSTKQASFSLFSRYERVAARPVLDVVPPTPSSGYPLSSSKERSKRGHRSRVSQD